MTREEAIENLKELLECSYVDKFEDAENEALEMAIKTLEQEPCYVSELTQKAYEDGKKDGYVQAKVEQEPSEDMTIAYLMGLYADKKPCSDVVSRQAVFEQINCWIGSGEYRYTNATDYLNKRIKALPPVNPQPKMGRWIDTDEWRETVDGFEQWGYFCKCSKCGYVFKFLEIDNYCPNCGARMKSEDKE